MAGNRDAADLCRAVCEFAVDIILEVLQVGEANLSRIVTDRCGSFLRVRHGQRGVGLGTSDLRAGRKSLEAALYRRVGLKVRQGESENRHRKQKNFRVHSEPPFWSTDQRSFILGEAR